MSAGGHDARVGGQRSAQLPMVTSTIGGATVAVELGEVVRIEALGGPQPPRASGEGFAALASAPGATAEAPRGPEPLFLDLAACWAVPVARHGRRRVVVVSARGVELRLLLGEGLRVVTFPAGALLAIPSFMQAWGRRAAVRALVATDDRLGYVLDLERLGELTEHPRR